MKAIVIFLSSILFVLSDNAQNNDSLTLQEFKHLSKKEIDAHYAIDDSSTALIKRYRLINTGTVIFTPIFTGMAFANGYATVILYNYLGQMAHTGAGMIGIMVVPLMIITSTTCILFATGDAFLITNFRSKKQLYHSLEYYRKHNQLQEKDRKGIKGFLKK